MESEFARGGARMASSENLVYSNGDDGAIGGGDRSNS